jgi:hypothetical protein
MPVSAIQVLQEVADCSCMSVSGISSTTPSDYAALQDERAVLVLKKAQDASKAQGQALADLVTKTTEAIGRIIKVYA